MGKLLFFFRRKEKKGDYPPVLSLSIFIYLINNMASKDGWVAPFLSIEKNPKIFYKDKKGDSPVPTYKVGAGGSSLNRR
jgi:hypothetical protein